MPLFRNATIRKKLIIIQVLTAFVAITVASIFHLLNEIRTFKKFSLLEKITVAEILAFNIASPLLFSDKDAARFILASMENNPSILNAVIVDKSGNEFTRYSKSGENQFAIPQLPESGISDYEFSGNKFVVSYKIYQQNEFLGKVILRAEFTNLNRIIVNYTVVASLVLLASLAAAFFISAFLQNTISRRLLKLVNKTREVYHTGDYSLRVPAEGNDEIGVLTEGFNKMLGKTEQMEKSLKESNVELENRVKKRTFELEAANNKLQEATEELTRSNTELEQFAYVASHDLQEPLRTISNFIHLIEEKNKDMPDLETGNYLGFILTATARMQQLIKDLLEYSRVGRNIFFTEVDCINVMKIVLKEMDAAIKADNAKINYGNLPVLTGNEIELKRLFQNLISNGVKFHRKGVAPELTVSAEEKQNEYLFSFKDNGIGIEEKYIKKLFVIFQRLHSTEEYPGTGIGLVICKKIVTLHKGKIWVESKVGKGSTFYFTISKKLIPGTITDENEKN